MSDVATKNEKLKFASAQLSDNNLRDGVDHDTQLRFMKKTAIVTLVGGFLSLAASIAFSGKSPETLEPSIHPAPPSYSIK